MVWNGSMKSDLLARQAAEAARYRSGVEPGRADVFAAIRRLGIRMLRHPLPEGTVEGAYVRRGSHAFILVNSSPVMSRQRFTAAHELGHHFLTPEDDLDHYDDIVDSTADRAANLFAGHFLMDTNTVVAAVAGIRDPLAASIRVMQLFEVSLPAAAIHLRDLDLIEEREKRSVFDDAEANTLAQLCQRVGAPGPPAGGHRDEIDPGPDYVEALVGEVHRGTLAPATARGLAYGIPLDLGEEEDFTVAMPASS